MDTLRKIREFLQGCPVDTYIADDLRQSAVERQLEIAGDALGQLRKLAPNLFARIPDGDLIVGFRNVLAHGYATLDRRKVFEVATSGAADLLQKLEALLEEFPE